MKPSRGDASDPMLAVSSQLVVVVLHIYIGLIRSGVDSRAIGKLSANERYFFFLPNSFLQKSRDHFRC